MQAISYINGKYVPSEQANISIYDRGFLFGDSIYEVIPVYNGVSIGLELHLDRLIKCAQICKFKLNYTHEQLVNIIQELIAFNPEANQSIYIQVTRGVENKRNHFYSQKTQACIYVMADKSSEPTIEKLMQGIIVQSAIDYRWDRCNIKTTSLMANILLLNQAYHAGYDEVILIRNGLALEGAKSNLFMIKNNTIITPPTNSLILPGVTRKIILSIAKELNIPFVERDISFEELATADELWLSGASRELSPVIELDSHKVGNGSAGPLWQRMISLYKGYIDDYVRVAKAKAIIT